jgi:hypothetical protein
MQSLAKEINEHTTNIIKDILTTTTDLTAIRRLHTFINDVNRRLKTCSNNVSVCTLITYTIQTELDHIDKQYPHLMITTRWNTIHNHISHNYHSDLHKAIRLHTKISYQVQRWDQRKRCHIIYYKTRCNDEPPKLEPGESLHTASTKEIQHIESLWTNKQL